MKLIVDYFFDDQEQPEVIRKIYTGNDDVELIRKAKENEYYAKCTSVEFDIDEWQ
jgi:hypothetical protein